LEVIAGPVAGGYELVCLTEVGDVFEKERVSGPLVPKVEAYKLLKFV
jgi:hypothetical protein